MSVGLRYGFVYLHATWVAIAGNYDRKTIILSSDWAYIGIIYFVFPFLPMNPYDSYFNTGYFSCESRIAKSIM